jgi:hypothetical protein
MLVRLVLIVAVVGAVGVFTGTIEPKNLLSHVPRVPHSLSQDPKENYLDLVDSNFGRLQPLSDGFFTSCDPGRDTTATCVVLADQMLKALRVFRADLIDVEVPPSLAAADAAMRRFVAKGLQGFTLVQRAARTHKHRDWVRARTVLADASTLLDRANEALDVSTRP